MRHRASNPSGWLVALSVLPAGIVLAIAIAHTLAPTLLHRISGEGRNVAAEVNFVGSYLAFAIGTMWLWL